MKEDSWLGQEFKNLQTVIMSDGIPDKGMQKSHQIYYQIPSATVNKKEITEEVMLCVSKIVLLPTVLYRIENISCYRSIKTVCKPEKCDFYKQAARRN